MPPGRPATWTDSTLGTGRDNSPRYELYCLMCGRGDGKGGALRATRVLPSFWANVICGYCGGRMMARDIDEMEVQRSRLSETAA